MIRRARLFLCLLLTALAASPAAAQGPATEPPLPISAPQAKVVVLGAPQPAAHAVHGDAVSLKGGTPTLGEPMRLAVNKSVELNLPAEARDIIVGSPDIADVVVRSPTLVFVVGRGPGQTNIYFRDRAGRTIGRLEIDVHIDSDALKDVLRQLLPDESGLQVAAVGDSIFLSGAVRSDVAASTARSMARRFVKEEGNVVNLLKVANEQQVLLHVKVAEMQKSALKELGLTTTLSGAQRLGNHTILQSAGAGNQTATSTQVLNNTVTANVPTTASSDLVLTSAAPYATMSVAGIGALASSFTLLEQQGLLKTLDEPTLTAVSGETATMLAGGEFPIPVSASNGSLSVAFKQFGVGLSFTPIVLDGGRISLKMQTEVSSVDKSLQVAVTQTTSVPGLKVRRAGSVVEMPSGGSVMIAGLLQNDITSTVAGMPGLMDVPILGALFRSNSFQHNESELVVVVSAYMVQPVDAGKMSLPTDGFAPSSDIDRFLLGRLQDTYAVSREPPPVPAQLQGPLGYIVQ